MIRKRSMLLAFAAASILALGTVFIVAAQSPTQTPTPGGVADRFVDRLAANLGISSDRLKTAIKDTGTQIVDEKLAAGEITQEQADRAKQRIAEGNRLRLGIRKEARPSVARTRVALNLTRAVADSIGMEPRALATEARSGKSFAQIAQEHGKSRDQLEADVMAKITAQLDEQVTAGRITAEQRGTMLDRFAGQLDSLLDKVPGARARPGVTATPQ